MSENTQVVYRRSAAFDRSSVDLEKRTARLSFSSETPVPRSFGNEVLDHSPSSVRMQRINAGAPLLFGHERSSQDKLLGVVDKGWIGNDKRGMADVRFSRSPEGERALQDAHDGILVNVSCSYALHDEPQGERAADGTRTFRFRDWEPLEISLVTVPADYSVGIGREFAPKEEPVAQVEIETAKAETKERGMTPEEQKAAADAERAESVKLERERVREVEALHTKYPEQLTREKADEFINGGTSLSEVRGHVLNGKQVAARENHVATIEVGTDEREKVGRGIRLARCVRAFAARKGDLREAAKFALETYSDPIAARALSASSAVGGGFLIAESLSQDMIEFLRPQAVVRSLNPVEVPLINGALNIPKMTAGTSASYIGENQNLPITGAQFGMVRMVAKKLAAVIPISNDLIRYQSLNSDTIVRDDLAAAIAQREDLAFIRDQGSNYTPTGLRYQVAAANVVAANALVGNPTGDMQAVIKSLEGQKLALRRANITFRRFGRIMSPRTEYYLKNLLTVNGVYVFRQEMENGKLLGDPYKVTTQIPENLVDGTQTEIYAADFADVLIGQVPTMVMEVSSDATYFDGAQLQSAFSLDQTVIKCIMEHDLGVRRQESLHVLTGVTWQ